MSYVKFLRQYVGHEPILTGGCGILVFNEKNEILMQLRTDYNCWGFPGGAMELGETFLEAAKRELEEETGLILEEAKLLEILSGEMTYREYPNGDKLYDITAIYEVRKYSGELRVNDDESKEVRWFNIMEVPENLSPMSKKYWVWFKDHYYSNSKKNIYEEWCNKLKEFWIQKDIPSILSLFTENVIYYETPFEQIDNIELAWHDIDEHNILSLDYQIIGTRDNTVIVNFKLNDNDRHIDMIYEIELNDIGKCISFKQWYMVKD